MNPRGNYYTLLGSLPTLPAHFDQAERVPISPRQLQERLRLLDADATAVLEQITDFLVWERQPMDRTDDAIGQRYIDFMQQVRNPFARDLIDLALKTRTIMAALRRRRLGLAPPDWTWPISDHVIRHWEHPDFRLGRQYPWIETVDQQLHSKTPFLLERTLLDIRWKRVKRLSEQYHFSFEAVVLYLLRWETVYRWTRRDAEAGKQKFERLVNRAMDQFADLFPA